MHMRVPASENMHFSNMFVLGYLSRADRCRRWWWERLEWCQQTSARCLCGPSGAEQQLSASLGDSDIEKSLLLITHIVHLTSCNLTELWLFSAAPALFTLLWNPAGLRPLLISIDPSGSESPSPALPPVHWLHVFTHLSLYSTFIYLPFILLHA